MAQDGNRRNQAVKHDRINNLKKGNIGNLLKALAALYVLNVYDRGGASFYLDDDYEGRKKEWGWDRRFLL